MSMTALYLLVRKRRQSHYIKKFVIFHSIPFHSIPQQERAMVVKDLDLDNDTLPMERALGVQ